MQLSGLRIGNPHSVNLGYTVLIIWGAMSLITIAAAVVALPTS
jgi:hypothetical protein